MKFSYRWIAELVPGLSIAGAELERLITMKTAECEGIHTVGEHFEQVVAARVVSAAPLPPGHNQKLTIDIGSGTQVQVVSGAPNVEVGMLAPWVPPGTVLSGTTIGRALINGVESEGMLASAAELGINRDHTGLLPLTSLAPGQHLPGLHRDWIIEVDNKSLTHRPDLWGHYGLAREVAAIIGATLKDPVKPSSLTSGSPVIEVTIADHDLCPRYSAVVLENVTVGPSPLWLQARLESIGVNAINNVVDVTNYVLSELPQPMHAFDAGKLIGNTIEVRRAVAGETIDALNGQRYELRDTDLVIADGSGPVAIAGVIGGALSAISETTTRIVLESANFSASSVRLTSSRLKLRTDASIRFEKSLDPENTKRGLARAVELLQQICPGVRMVGGVTDTYRSTVQPRPILLPLRVVTKKLGKEVGESRVRAILESLGFAVKDGSPGSFSVLVPSWRATKDISHRDDLVEEVGRMIGYGEITPVPPLAACTTPPSNPMRLYLRGLRSALADQGFTETYNYSFVNHSDVSRFGMSVTDHLAVKNPIASELTHMRKSLLPGLFKNIVDNVRHYKNFRLFEIGREIHVQAELGVPIERTKAAAVLFDAHANERDFFELKRVVEGLFPACRLTAAKALVYEHPMRAAEISWSQTVIGRLFELHPSLLEAEGVPGRAMLFDVDLDVAQKIAAERVIRYKALRRYPTSGFDLSIVARISTPVDVIEGGLRQFAGEALASIEFVRQYAGAPLTEGQKSVSYHLEIGATNRTMTAEEVTSVRNQVIDGMRQQGYDLRV